MIIALDTLNDQLLQAGFKKKKLAELRIPDVYKEYWSEIELTSVCDKSQTRGIIIFFNASNTYAVKYELKKIKPNSKGISGSILCDFCYTLQPRSKTAVITFDLNREKTRSVSFYCCADLQCSLHVRGLTDASLVSKSQIREDIIPQKRIDRFVAKTTTIFTTNGAVIVN
jgi:hypothetical protein